MKLNQNIYTPVRSIIPLTNLAISLGEGTTPKRFLSSYIRDMYAGKVSAQGTGGLSLVDYTAGKGIFIANGGQTHIGLSSEFYASSNILFTAGVLSAANNNKFSVLLNGSVVVGPYNEDAGADVCGAQLVFGNGNFGGSGTTTYPQFVFNLEDTWAGLGSSGVGSNLMRLGAAQPAGQMWGAWGGFTFFGLMVDGGISAGYEIINNGYPNGIICAASRIGIATNTPLHGFDCENTFGRKTQNITTNTTIVLSALRYRLLCSNAITITLPTAVGCLGREYQIINVGVNTITIATNSGQTINGGSGYSLTTQWQVVKVVSDGANWVII